MNKSISPWSEKFKNRRCSMEIVITGAAVQTANPQTQTFHRPIKDDFIETVDELVYDLQRLEQERKQKTQRISEIQRMIAPLEREVVSLQDEIDSGYKRSFDRLRRLRGLASIRDVWAIYERVEAVLPWFDWFEDRQIETSNWFFHTFDLDRFHWAYAHLNWFDWDDFDDFLINGESGQNLYGIDGGLEIYQDSFDRLTKKIESVLPPDGYPCIYFLRGRNMEIIYVGQSRAIRSRLKTHFRDRRKGEAEIYEVIRIRSADDLEREEYRMIKKFSPRLNKFIPKDRWSIGDIATYEDELLS